MKKTANRKNRLVTVIMMVLVCVLLYFIGYRYVYLNRPSEISKELQKKITEEMGKGYKLTYPIQEDTHIDCVYIDVKSDLYEDKNIFRNCNKLKELVYQFIKDHPYNFDLVPLKDKEVDQYTSNAKGFELRIEDTKGGKLYGGGNSVFVFKNCLAEDDRYVDGFYYLGAGAKGLAFYGYKLSDFTEIKGIQELSLDEVEIDNPDALADMKELECVYWTGHSSEGEPLHAAAKKHRVKFVQIGG